MNDLNLRRAAPDGRQSRCRAENQEHLARYLLDHPCVDCGEQDVRVLDFDHEDPDQKTRDVGRLATFGLPWPRVLEEIDKCSVRCANCHRRRTSTMSGWWRTDVETRRRRHAQEQAATRLLTVLG